MSPCVGDAKDKDDIGVKDDTDVVIKGGKDPNKPAETSTDGSADEVEKQKPVVDAEPGEPAEKTGTELLVWPEDAKSGEAQEKDDPEPRGRRAEDAGHAEACREGRRGRR